MDPDTDPDRTLYLGEVCSLPMLLVYFYGNMVDRSSLLCGHLPFVFNVITFYIRCFSSLIQLLYCLYIVVLPVIEGGTVAQQVKHGTYDQ